MTRSLSSSDHGYCWVLTESALLQFFWRRVGLTGEGISLLSMAAALVFVLTASTLELLWVFLFAATLPKVGIQFFVLHPQCSIFSLPSAPISAPSCTFKGGYIASCLLIKSLDPSATILRYR